jgi:hypothetical protein
VTGVKFGETDGKNNKKENNRKCWQQFIKPTFLQHRLSILEIAYSQYKADI